MELTATTLVDAALKMTAGERARIVAALIDSLGGPTDPNVEQAWSDEVEQRADDIKSGNVPGRSWDEVQARARQARGT